MSVNAESTTSRIILTIKDSRGPFVLQRAFYRDKTWLTWTTDKKFALIGDDEVPDERIEEIPNIDYPEEWEEEFEQKFPEGDEVIDLTKPTENNSNNSNENENEDSEENTENSNDLEDSENDSENPTENDENIETPEETETTENESSGLEAELINEGDFIDSFDLEDGLWEYRYIPLSIFEDETLTDEEKLAGENWTYTKWVKYGNPDCIGYSFGNYSPPEGSWGNAITPDDCRYTFLWGTDFKATNGSIFKDEQIQFFIDQAVSYLERELNITIKKRVIKSQASDRNLKKTTSTEEGDYTDEETLYDFSYRKIQRYGMITTQQRPILSVEALNLVNRDKSKTDLLDSMILDKKKGIIKFLKKPWKMSQKFTGLADALGMYGSETINSHLFYEIDYTAGFENSDELPRDLREIIGKVTAISLLNIIGDGLMSGFSSSSLSMDGISESFSSTQSATSAYFGARIQVYKDDVKSYIEQNRYKFGYLPMGAL